MHEHLPALAVKIAKMLSIKPEYLVTQPAELRILREMSETDVREFAKSSRLACDTSSRGAADRILQ